MSSFKYWESEQPITIETKKNALKLYPKAKKLQVAQPDWTNDKGKKCHGKSVTLDIQSLKEIANGAEFFIQLKNCIG